MSSSPSLSRHTLFRLTSVGITFGLAVALIAPALVAAATPKTVQMLANTYSPATLSVNVGTTVTFKNTSQFPHTATADNGAFDTGMISPGASKSIVLKKTGPIPFHCQFHGGAGGVGQSGTITVMAAPAAASQTMKPAAGGRTPLPPSTDTRPGLSGPAEGLSLAAVSLIAILLAFGLDEAVRARRRRSER